MLKVRPRLSTILLVGIYAKKKNIHLTRNVQITAYKQLNTCQTESFFVRDGIHSDADYNSSRVGVGVVVVVVVVVAIFTMG